MREDRRHRVRAIAEANAYIYYQLRDIGITSQIDENIGIEFMNLDLIMAANSFASSSQNNHRSSSDIQEELETSKLDETVISDTDSISNDALLFDQIRTEFIQESNKELGLN